MTFKRFAVLPFCLVLAGCSSERPDVTAFSFARGLLAPETQPAVNDPAQVAQQMNDALASLDGPLALATFEKTENSVVLWQIETNGAYRTWTSWGANVDRRTLTTRHGILTATRGLGNDLMSSDVGETLRLVRSRQSGTANRAQRYLNGENQVYEVRAVCKITRGSDVRVQVGEINRAAIEMTEDCTAGERAFRNIYRVDGNGTVLQSVQWLNDEFGVTALQALR